MKKKTAKIKILIGLLVCALLFPTCLTSCASDPPLLEDVRDRFTQLIEDSYEINEIFFGNGLPTYARGSDIAEETNMYYGLVGYDTYEYVTLDGTYFFIDQIKIAAEKVYSAEYLEGIYTMAFDGYMDENSDNVSTARYLEVDGALLRYAPGENDPFNILPGERRYNFDTMEIVRPSNAKSVNVKIDSYLVGDEQNILSVTLRFVLQDEEWYLDSPTY